MCIKKKVILCTHEPIKTESLSAVCVGDLRVHKVTHVMKTTSTVRIYQDFIMKHENKRNYVHLCP